MATWTHWHNINEIIAYIKHFQILAPLVGFVLIVMQAQIPYIPYFILAAANGIIFGFWPGFIINWLAAITGALMNFYIARMLGQNWLARHIKPDRLHSIQKISLEKGFVSILIGRLIPVIPASLINAAAGISEVKVSTFLVASAIGKLPFVFIYTFLGYEIINAKYFSRYISLAALFIILAIIILKTILSKRSKLF